FEPPTLCSQSRCATRLRYAPTLVLIVSRTVSLSKPATRTHCLHLLPVFTALHLLFDEPRQKPHKDHQRNGKKDAERCCEQEQESPVPPSMAPRLAEVAAHQLVVAAIRLPGNVEDVAEEGN